VSSPTLIFRLSDEDAEELADGSPVDSTAGSPDRDRELGVKQDATAFATLLQADGSDAETLAHPRASTYLGELAQPPAGDGGEPSCGVPIGESMRRPAGAGAFAALRRLGHLERPQISGRGLAAVAVAAAALAVIASIHHGRPTVRGTGKQRSVAIAAASVTAGSPLSASSSSPPSGRRRLPPPPAAITVRPPRPARHTQRRRTQRPRTQPRRRYPAPSAPRAAAAAPASTAPTSAPTGEPVQPAPVRPAPASSATTVRPTTTPAAGGTPAEFSFER